MKKLILSKKQILLIFWAAVLTVFCAYAVYYLSWAISTNLNTLEILTAEGTLEQLGAGVKKGLINGVLLLICTILTYASFIALAVFNFLSERKRLGAGILA